MPAIYDHDMQSATQLETVSGLGHRVLTTRHGWVHVVRKRNGGTYAFIVEPFRKERFEQLPYVALIHIGQWYERVLQITDAAPHLLRLVVCQ